MHKTLALLPVLTLALAACSTFDNLKTLTTFDADPLVSASFRSGSTKQSILSVRQPDRRTPIRGGTSECFDYKLRAAERQSDFYVGFTNVGRVNANGYLTCAEAIKAGYLDSNALPKPIY